MTLNEIKINDNRVSDHLIKFLSKVETWRSFSTDQSVTVFYSVTDQDLVAVESEALSWGFISYNHKPSDMRFTIPLEHIKYDDFKRWVEGLSLPF